MNNVTSFSFQTFIGSQEICLLLFAFSDLCGSQRMGRGKVELVMFGTHFNENLKLGDIIFHRTYSPISSFCHIHIYLVSSGQSYSYFVTKLHNQLLFVVTSNCSRAVTLKIRQRTTSNLLHIKRSCFVSFFIYNKNVCFLT